MRCICIANPVWRDELSIKLDILLARCYQLKHEVVHSVIVEKLNELVVPVCKQVVTNSALSHQREQNDQLHDQFWHLGLQSRLILV